MKTKKKKMTGSLRIDPDVLELFVKYCKDKGIKVSFYATEAIREKLQKSK